MDAGAENLQLPYLETFTTAAAVDVRVLGQPQ